MDAARDEALRIPALLLDDRLDDAHLVGLVVDREVRLVGKPRRLAAEDAPAGGVEGHHPHALGDVAEDGLEAALHLPGRLVREGDGEDLVRLHAAGRDEMGDAVGEHARLPRAGAGDDEHGPFRGEHRLALGGVQVREVLLGGGHCHDVDGIRLVGAPCQGRVLTGHARVPGPWPWRRWTSPARKRRGNVTAVAGPPPPRPCPPATAWAWHPGMAGCGRA